jgi:hypothetical protein
MSGFGEDGWAARPRLNDRGHKGSGTPRTADRRHGLRSELSRVIAGAVQIMGECATSLSSGVRLPHDSFIDGE